MTYAIRRILAPVDFSKNSRRAVEYAADLGKALGAKVDLLHVWDAPPYIPVDAILGVNVDTVSAWAVKSAHDALDTFIKELASAGIGVSQGIVRSGAISATIVETAVSDGYDLIVIGTQGRTGLSHLLMGSVAERVVRISRCPVVTVPNHATG